MKILSCFFLVLLSVSSSLYSLDCAYYDPVLKFKDGVNFPMKNQTIIQERLSKIQMFDTTKVCGSINAFNNDDPMMYILGKPEFKLDYANKNIELINNPVVTKNTCQVNQPLNGYSGCSTGYEIDNFLPGTFLIFHFEAIYLQNGTMQHIKVCSFPNIMLRG